MLFKYSICYCSSTIKQGSLKTLYLFKYSICYCSRQYHIASAMIVTHLNTASVIVQVITGRSLNGLLLDLNTASVIVQDKIIPSYYPKTQFKYSICYCSSTGKWPFLFLLYVRNPYKSTLLKFFTR